MQHDKDFIGVLLINTGTPSNPEPTAIREYLKEFLSDIRIIHLPRFIWLPILYLFILPIRPRKKTYDYKKIWMKEGSPILVLFQKFLNKLNNNISKNKKIIFHIAMRYGEPTIKSKLELFKKQQVSKIIILPLFPQFSFTTTESIKDKVSDSFRELKWHPKIKVINEYYREKIFIKSIAKTIKDNWEENRRKQLLIFSYHGLPKKYIKQGDTYYFSCCETSKLVARELNLNRKDFITSFHSKFGLGEWTKPYTEELLLDLPNKGIKSINIVSPSFSIDCLETLEEIAIKFKKDFMKAGGNSFSYIPCLNDSDDHKKIIEELIEKNKIF